eukprot:383153-Amphidinium_carterae.5
MVGSQSTARKRAAATAIKTHFSASPSSYRRLKPPCICMLTGLAPNTISGCPSILARSTSLCSGYNYEFDPLPVV